MREIKFRAWDEVNKLMRSDVASIDFEKRKIYFVNEANTLNSDERREFWHEPFKLIEYTGLKDKNGREIFEGDIVRLCCNGFHNNVEIFKGEVIFEEGSFEVKAKGEYTCLHDGAGLTTSEVIGNIYENPELLEESK